MLTNLKRLREETKTTQKQLADALSVSQQSINKYENHNIEPDIKTLSLMADYFNTSIDYIVGRSAVRRTMESVRPYELSEEESGIVDAFRKMTQKQRHFIKLLIDSYGES